MTDSDKAEIAEIVEARIRKLAQDGAFVDPLWRGGYDRMSAHGLDALSLWIGRKIVALIAAAALAGALTFAAVKGAK